MTPSFVVPMNSRIKDGNDKVKSSLSLMNKVNTVVEFPEKRLVTRMDENPFQDREYVRLD